MRARACCRLDDLEGTFERLVVVARHFGNDKRWRVEAYTPAAQVESG
jgi:hypothetical protein